MQSFLILAQAGLYTAWATAPDGIVHRLHVYAHNQPDAIEAAFRQFPRAKAISARPLDRAEPGDALGFLDRRADVVLP